MNLDVLSQLFGGQGNQTMGMLLPLLLGGKGDNGGDMTSKIGVLADLISKGSVGTSKGDFPPLFGDGNGERQKGELWSIINGITSNRDPSARQKTPASYPYELQYNRPDPIVKR